MKKYLLPVALIVISACRSESDYFNGFGDTMLGNNIHMIASDSLVKEADGIYSIKAFKLSDQTGVVKNLKIRTHNDKIYYVSFSVDEATNRTYIYSVLSSLMKHSLLRDTIRNPDHQLKMIDFNDGVVLFGKTIVGNDSIVDYSYFNIRETVE